MHKYSRIFSSVVNGRVKNVYSTYDRMLYLFEMNAFQGFPIGRHPIIIPNSDQPDKQEQNNDDDIECSLV